MANQTEILETIVAGTCRKRFELQKLRRILGYGEAIYPPKLPPLSIHRDEWLEILESGGEDLHLSDDIVPIVAETQFPGSLCRAVFDFEPEQQWRNYDKVKAAAPGMLAALGLRDIWWDWFGDSWVGAPAGEIHTSYCTRCWSSILQMIRLILATCFLRASRRIGKLGACWNTKRLKRSLIFLK